MNFSWREEEIVEFDQVVEFAKAKLNTDLVQRDHNAEFSRDEWLRLGGAGVLGWITPAEYGGSGYSPLKIAHLMEALGYGCADNGLLFALGTQLWGVQSALLKFGTPLQKSTYLPRMIRGDAIGAYAINEPGSGSDAFALHTTATPNEEGYLLKGEKTLISMSPVADFAIVFAVTNQVAGRWGISTFIVDKATPGFVSHPNERMMGLRTAPYGKITLDQCQVSRDALLGKEGSGSSIFGYSQCWERSMILAPQVGTMKRQIEQCVHFAKKRTRAGKAIGTNQAVSHRIAEMQIRLECSRLLLHKTAWLLEEGKQNLMEAAITKTYLSEAFVNSSREAVNLFGGTGYLTESGVERNLRDAVGGTIYGGTVDIQRNIIAGLLGL